MHSLVFSHFPPASSTTCLSTTCHLPPACSEACTFHPFTLPGELYTYDSIDAVEDNVEEQQHLPQEFLRSLMPSGLPPSTLRLKVGAPIVLLRNLYPVSGECNGTRLIITRLGRRCIEGRMLGGEFNGQLRLIPRIKLTTTENDLPYILNRRQYPIRLCLAMTVNKSQG